MNAVSAFLDGVLRGQGAVMDAKRQAPARIPLPSYPPPKTQAEVDERMAEALERVIETGANRMVKEPWRVVRAVFGAQIMSPHWPWQGMDAEAVLSICRHRMALRQEQARRGHWSAFDSNLDIALRQAERALVRMGGEGK